MTTTRGDRPAALGNRIAAAVIATGLADGANEAGGYAATDYEPVNPPLVVAEAGTRMVDPNRWQPLQLEEQVSQNGIPLVDTVQHFVGAEWGRVAGFALPRGGAPGMPIPPGEPPRLGDPDTEEEFRTAAVEVLELSSLLDPGQGATIDISPGAMGANSLGTTDGHGRPQNPVTGQPYPPNVVNHADFGRAVAESGPTGHAPRRHRATGTSSPTRCPTCWRRTSGSAGRGRPWTASSGTSSSTWPSTGRTTTPRSPPGAPRATTTTPAPSP